MNVNAIAVIGRWVAAEGILDFIRFFSRTSAARDHIRAMPPSATPVRSPDRGADPVRGVVTVALVLYLGGLVLSVAGNTASGTSALVRTIKSRIFSPVLVPAWLDLGFEVPLTYGLPEDADHAFELQDARGVGTRLRFPAPSLAGERAARWRRLARGIAAGDASGDAPSLLATAVATAGFTALGVDDATIRVVRPVLPERGAAGGTARPEQPFEARVRRVGEEVHLIRKEEAATVAPLLRPDGARGAAPADGRPGA